MGLNKLKYCYYCKSNKSLEKFNQNKSRKDGKDSLCKKCKKDKNKIYRSKPEIKKRDLLKGKEWKKNNPDKVRITGFKMKLRSKYNLTENEFWQM